MNRHFTASIVIALVALAAPGQDDPVSRSWNQPVEPFQILGNVYYVGASDVTSFLITTPNGHILIDSGFVENVPQILQNVPKLGFQVKDIRILLNNHAHYDHAGGFALLQRLTGAQLIASRGDVAQLRRGGVDDFAFGNRFSFEPPPVDRIIDDGARVTLGGVTLTARLTPGHTKGNTTWTMSVKDGEEERAVVFAGSLSAPGYQLVGNKRYPEIVEDFRRSFEMLRTMKADVFLSSHGSFFGLKEKIELGGTVRETARRAEGYSRISLVT